MRRIVVFTGPQGSGKSKQAIKLAEILENKNEVMVIDAGTADKMAYRKAVCMYQVAVIEGCKNAAEVVKLSDLIDEIKQDMDFNLAVIFTTQDSCAELNRERFRVVACDKVNNEYRVIPLHG